MTIKTETSLRDFNFWAGAKINANTLTNEQLDEIEEILEAEYPDGLTDTELNDFFWFSFDTIKELLGIEDGE